MSAGEVGRDLGGELDVTLGGLEKNGIVRDQIQGFLIFAQN